MKIIGGTPYSNIYSNSYGSAKSSNIVTSIYQWDVNPLNSDIWTCGSSIGNSVNILNATRKLNYIILNKIIKI